MVFIGRYGVFAVVLSQVIGAVVMAVFRYIIVNKYMYYRMNLIKMLLATVLYVILSVICIMASVGVVWVLLAISVMLAIVLNLGVLTALLNRKNTH